MARLYFQIEATDKLGAEYRDECSAGSENEARAALAETGYTLKSIRLKRIKTWLVRFAAYFDQCRLGSRQGAYRVPIVPWDACGSRDSDAPQ